MVHGNPSWSYLYRNLVSGLRDRFRCIVPDHLGCGFSDADDFHPAANVEKMRRGIPLTDDDRWPWLGALRQAIDDWQATGTSHVIACSALRQSYRDVLSSPGDVLFVYLKGAPETVAARLEARKGHYMNPNLLASQFETLEEPQGALVVDITPTPEAIVETILSHIAALGSDGKGARA